MFVGTVALEEPLKSNIRLFERVRLVSLRFSVPSYCSLVRGLRMLKRGWSFLATMATKKMIGVMI